jgi:hypothetical protein
MGTQDQMSLFTPVPSGDGTAWKQHSPARRNVVGKKEKKLFLRNGVPNPLRNCDELIGLSLGQGLSLL